MVTSSWLQKHDTVFLLQHFRLIPACLPQGLWCNLVICLELPFSIFTTFEGMQSYKSPLWHQNTAQYVSGDLFLPMAHKCEVTVVLQRLDYKDNCGSQWSFRLL